MMARSSASLAACASGCGLRERVAVRMRSAFESRIWCGMAWVRKSARSCSSERLTPWEGSIRRKARRRLEGFAPLHWLEDGGVLGESEGGK